MFCLDLSESAHPRHAARHRPRRKKAPRAPRPKPILTAYIEYVLFLLLFHGLRALPFALTFRLGGWLGRLLYYLDRPHRQVGMINLAIAFPTKTPSERRAILREACTNLGRMVVEFCHLRSLTRENVHKYVTLADPELWRRLVAELSDKGALILTGHFGNWEYLAYAHALYGYPVHIVHRPLRNRLIDAFIIREREHCGTKILRKSTAGFEVLRALKQKGLVVLPIDQNASGRMAVFVDFFSRSASSSVGLATLALKSGVAVVPAFLVREGATPRHRIVLSPPVEPVRTGNLERDLQETTQKFTRIFEQMVAQYPDHWLWLHKRWKRRPEHEPPVY